MAEQLTKLWIAYASYEASLKQWKKAVQIYDDALQDELVSKTSAIYISYADFCIFRKKHSNALKVFVKGLKADLSDVHYDNVWIGFSRFMNNTSPEKLSFDDLYTAISQQVDIPLKKPSENAIEIITKGHAVVEEAEHTAAAIESTESSIIQAETPITPTLPSDVGSKQSTEEVPATESDLYVPEAAEADRVLADKMEVVESGFTPLPLITIDVINTDDMQGFKYPENCELYRHRPPSLFSSPDTVSCERAVTIPVPYVFVL